MFTDQLEGLESAELTAKVMGMATSLNEPVRSNKEIADQAIQVALWIAARNNGQLLCEYWRALYQRPHQPGEKLIGANTDRIVNAVLTNPKVAALLIAVGKDLPSNNQILLSLMEGQEGKRPADILCTVAWTHRKTPSPLAEE